MIKVLVHHAEIGLKGGNFSYFEKKLVGNIRKKSSKNNCLLEKIERKDKRILCVFKLEENTKNRERVKSLIESVFGIQYFAFVKEVSKDIEKMKEQMERILSEKSELFDNNSKKETSFKTKRSDKNFPLNSIEINKEFGEIASKKGIKVNYQSENIVFTEISSRVFMYTEKFLGFGGLPVGTSGKVLVLLSGGIDSPVAAWLAMKRGCSIDFLHFHTHKGSKEVMKTKINELLKILNRYQIKSKVYFVPYSFYEVESQGRFLRGYDLIMFKYYLLSFSEKLALKKKYGAIITGDNLAQVASQTIENIRVTSKDIKIPILRPLITYDKQEIIDLAKKIGTYNISIKSYKDCCSILANKPSTKTKIEKFERELKRMNFSKLIQKSLENMEEVNLQ